MNYNISEKEKKIYKNMKGTYLYYTYNFNAEEFAIK